MKNRTLEAHKIFFDNYLIFSTGLGIFTYKNLEDILCIRHFTFFQFFILYSWLYYLFSPDSSGSYLRLTWYLIIYLLITRRAEKQEQRCSFSFTFRCRVFILPQNYSRSDDIVQIPVTFCYFSRKFQVPLPQLSVLIIH